MNDAAAQLLPAFEASSPGKCISRKQYTLHHSSWIRSVLVSNPV